MSQRSVNRAVIVGCGIAGPALAIFLRRLGIDVVICERRPSEAVDEGLFLGVAPNGMNILTELGLDQAVKQVSVPCDRFEFLNARGHVIGVINREDDEAKFGARLQMIRRGDLHRVLTDAARAEGVEIYFGRALTRIDRCDGGPVAARFAGGSCERGDILIGCDGIQSAVRQIALPGSPHPSYSGLLDCGGITDKASIDIPIGVNVMVFGRRAFFGAFKTPSGHVWWFQNSGGDGVDAVPRQPGALREHLLALHRDDPPWIRETIASTDRVVGPFALNDILFMPRWHDGRVCLVGDAAHATTPSSGQGASLALEDAMILAQQLRDHAVPEQAFAAFERARRRRVETIVKQSRRTGNTKAVSSPVGEWIRDRLLPFFLRFGSAVQDRQYAFRVRWC